MLAVSRCAIAIMLAMTTKVTQISLMVWVALALGKHQIAQQLLGHPCSVRSEKQTAMAENSCDWCRCARCPKKAFQKWLRECKLFVIRHKVPGYSGLSSIMNARYEATTVSTEMWITYNAVCIIIHQGLENVETFSSRPRSRPRLLIQDQDNFSCPRGASRPRPRSRDYISIDTCLSCEDTPRQSCAIVQG